MEIDQFRRFDDRALRVLLSRNPHGYFVTDRGQIVKLRWTPFADRVRGVAVVVSAFIGMKAMVIAGAGFDDYEARRLAMADGGMASRIVAQAMAADPVSGALAKLLRKAIS